MTEIAVVYKHKQFVDRRGYPLFVLPGRTPLKAISTMLANVDPVWIGASTEVARNPKGGSGSITIRD
ncbi:MAG: hypothetical protein U1F48_05645 [Burkholderiales bacterium]